MHLHRLGAAWVAGKDVACPRLCMLQVLTLPEGRHHGTCGQARRARGDSRLSVARAHDPAANSTMCWAGIGRVCCSGRRSCRSVGCGQGCRRLPYGPWQPATVDGFIVCTRIYSGSQSRRQARAAACTSEGTRSPFIHAGPVGKAACPDELRRYWSSDQHYRKECCASKLESEHRRSPRRGPVEPSGLPKRVVLMQ